jgi:hypothetical protein
MGQQSSAESTSATHWCGAVGSDRLAEIVVDLHEQIVALLELLARLLLVRGQRAVSGSELALEARDVRASLLQLGLLVLHGLHGVSEKAQMLSS